MNSWGSLGLDGPFFVKFDKPKRAETINRSDVLLFISAIAWQEKGIGIISVAMMRYCIP